MALIPCTECGRQVSDQAASCPQCGAPVGPGGLVPAQPTVEEWALSRLMAGTARRQVVDEIVQHGTLMRTEADALVKRLEEASVTPAGGRSRPNTALIISALVFLMFLFFLFMRAPP